MKHTHPSPPPRPAFLPGFPARAWQPPVALLAGALAACAPTTPATRPVQETTATPGRAILPEALADPIEPLNRGVWGVNRGLMEGVIHPTGQVYRTIVPKPARISITNFTRNITYPGRAVNQVLQGRWQDAGDESLRFLCNTTAGVGGFFDVATRWNIPQSEAAFGQTFQHWGWKPSNYLMLPFFGPSDECNALGLAFDETTEPWNWVAPLRQISYGTTYNRLAETSGETVRFIRSEADPYSTSKLVWGFLSNDDPPDWTVRGPRDTATLQTLGAAAISLDDPEFVDKGRQASVRIPATGRRMPYNLWLQKNPAPLVYVNPGLGSHRLSMSTLAVAETLYQNGFSVVATTSVFHPEFMETASSAALPAHPPTDARDLLAALAEIDRALEHKHPGHFRSRALVGCSMGAYQTLYLAAREKSGAPDFPRFERYVAINPPVDLHHGIACIDGFHDAPLAWPADQRQALVNNAVRKVRGLATGAPAAGQNPPFDAVESRYLIGLTFRLTLRDAIFSSQSRHDLGVLRAPLSQWRREPVYDEILGYSYRDYVERFAFPYYRSQGLDVADFKKFGTLKGFAGGLRGNPKVRVITNRNDFLLAPGDLGWLESTLGKSRVRVFPNGGHLGNLASREVRSALCASLEGLK